MRKYPCQRLGKRAGRLRAEPDSSLFRCCSRRALRASPCRVARSYSGFSTDPDEEACIVQIALGSVPADADPSSRLLPTPNAVLEIAPEIPERSRAIRRDERGAATY